MELQQLRTFLAVARAGNLTKAAEGLFLTQPAISRQIQALEAELGMPVFERTGRGVHLTDAGAVLREYAERCMALLEDCAQAMADVRAGAAGRIVVGVGGTHPMAELPAWLQAYAAEYPTVDVSIRTGRSQEIIDAVRERRLDVAFVRVPVSDPELAVVTLYEEDIVLVGSAEHFAAGTTLTPDDARDLPFILFPAGTSFRAQLDRAFAVVGFTPRVRMETDSVEEMARFAALGFGIAFLPAGAVAEAGGLMSLTLAGLPALTRQTALIYRRERYMSAALRGFVAAVSGRVPSP